MSTQSPPAAPAIYRISIERFRGIGSLIWHPTRGMNVILGGGDVGKTTILDAIGLLLSPANTGASDTDYYTRNIELGFAIEAVVSLPPGCGINHQFKPSWPWEWDGKDAAIPNTEGDGKPAGEAVYKLRVRGTEDLDLV
jgi:hypothetical protein